MFLSRSLSCSLLVLQDIMVGLLGVDTGVCLCPLSFMQRGVVKHATVRTLGCHPHLQEFQDKDTAHYSSSSKTL
jgi:hypothetical protein